MLRLYDNLIAEHIKTDQQMFFIAGPRQVGKTTASKTAQSLTANFGYLNWDNQDDRSIILSGPAAVYDWLFGHKVYGDSDAIIVFDEIHKYSHWKTFLKGFYDSYKDKLHIIVTGSSRLDVFKVGGDSLMGRYFLYRMHPLSVAECLRQIPPEQEISKAQELDAKAFAALWDFGGFPQPFLRGNKNFSNRWNRLRKQQLFHEDIRDLTRIHDVHRMEVLAELLRQQAGSLTKYSNLATKLRVSNDTVVRWVKTLQSVYYCFSVQPWTKNITRSLLKEPKIFLWDWSLVQDVGARAENFIASHLLKAVDYWTDQGFGEYGLHFIRDLEKREVDFLVSRNGKAWFLVEVKMTEQMRFNKNLRLFQEATGAKHAFQVVLNMDYVDVDCFSYIEPVIVPAKTFLAQLV